MTGLPETVDDALGAGLIWGVGGWQCAVVLAATDHVGFVQLTLAKNTDSREYTVLLTPEQASAAYKGISYQVDLHCAGERVPIESYAAVDGTIQVSGSRGELYVEVSSPAGEEDVEFCAHDLRSLGWHLARAAHRAGQLAEVVATEAH